MRISRLHPQLIWRIFLLALNGLALGPVWVRGSTIYLLILAAILVLQTYLLIRYLDRTDKKITYFFDALKNEDFMLRFPERADTHIQQELHKSLNKVNHRIRETHEELQARENYYQTILKEAHIGILTYNEKGHILFRNPSMEKLLDHSPLNHINQLRPTNEACYQVLKPFVPFEHKMVEISNEREKRPISLKSTPIALQGESLLLVLAQDIHKALEEKETDSWAKLIRVLTHEIMNTVTPITSISGSILSFFEQDGKVKERDQLDPSHLANTVKGLRVVKEQGEDLMAFVQSYRTLLHVPPPDKALVRADQLLEKIRLLVTSQDLPMATTIRTKVEPADLELFLDEKQVSLILLNLCKNALQAMEGRTDSLMELRAGQKAHGGTYLGVRDNGPGIPQELLDQIFVPFFTTKEKGTGIGLSLSKQIMHLHGGTVSVRSDVGEGTLFLLEFN